MIYEKELNRTLESYEQWWAGALDRPLIPVTLTDRDPGRKPPRHPYEGQKSFGNPDISPAELIDGADYQLCQMEFLGDSYPLFNGICSGPGIVAAFLGANVNIDSGSIWFFPKRELPIEEIHFEYDPDNFWLNRTKDVMSEARRRWGDSVVVGMPDLGGVADILATFRGSQNLLLDLYDSPDEVLRAIGEIKLLWQRYYDELAPYASEGFHTDWSAILSAKRSYMLQSDFSYMLSAAMFGEFIADELDDTCAFLDRGCYHLDGVGQIQHLPRLLEIKNLQLVQWVPGSGPYEENDWSQLYCQILDAGRHLQIMYDAGLKSLDKVIAQRGTGRNIIENGITMPTAQRKQALEILARYQ